MKWECPGPGRSSIPRCQSAVGWENFGRTGRGCRDGVGKEGRGAGGPGPSPPLLAGQGRDKPRDSGAFPNRECCCSRHPRSRGAPGRSRKVFQAVLPGAEFPKGRICRDFPAPSGAPGAPCSRLRAVGRAGEQPGSPLSRQPIRSRRKSRRELFHELTLDQRSLGDLIPATPPPQIRESQHGLGLKLHPGPAPCRGRDRSQPGPFPAQLPELGSPAELSGAAGAGPARDELTQERPGKPRPPPGCVHAHEEGSGGG